MKENKPNFNSPEEIKKMDGNSWYPKKKNMAFRWGKRERKGLELN